MTPSPVYHKRGARVDFPPPPIFSFFSSVFFPAHFPKDVVVIARFDHVKKPFEGSGAAETRGRTDGRPAASGGGGWWGVEVQTENGGSGCVCERLSYSPPGSRRTVAAPQQRQRGHGQGPPPRRQMVQPDKRQTFISLGARGGGTVGAEGPGGEN